MSNNKSSLDCYRRSRLRSLQEYPATMKQQTISWPGICQRRTFIEGFSNQVKPIPSKSQLIEAPITQITEASPTQTIDTKPASAAHWAHEESAIGSVKQGTSSKDNLFSDGMNMVRGRLLLGASKEMMFPEPANWTILERSSLPRDNCTTPLQPKNPRRFRRTCTVRHTTRGATLQPPPSLGLSKAWQQRTREVATCLY
ncbi:hypothetical protein BDZ85DRAFT_85279 [Elsinoe ampelina]|uniref:Uncharacterized protein n=1 Tax=Elsinoe ampelina TaxID=302913 RepID=A0A6A6GGM9_9PEZI|nr:hypothetical protein BDZ85DRAFT_85279 [Elsinoe ampelina]